MSGVLALGVGHCVLGVGRWALGGGHCVLGVGHCALGVELPCGVEDARGVERESMGWTG